MSTIQVLIVPRQAETRSNGVRVVNPYNKIPHLQAGALPVYVRIKNVGTDTKVALPISVQIDRSHGTRLLFADGNAWFTR